MTAITIEKFAGKMNRVGYDAFLQGIVQPAFDPAQSGGALMDINVYNIHALVGLFGKPAAVQLATPS